MSDAVRGVSAAGRLGPGRFGLLGSRRRGRLFRKYVLLFVGLVSLVLLVNGSLDFWFSYEGTKAALFRIQQEKADSAARRIGEFVDEIERQRQTPPAPWGPVKGALIRRLGVQTFGIIGLGRIGTAVALRARAFGFRVMFYDPHLPNGAELALGIARAPSLENLLRQTDTLSIHTPLTPETRGMLGHAELALLPKGAVVVNTARGPIIELDALLALLRSGHIAAAGLDVLPVEPPVEPIPELLRAYRVREPGLEGRLVVTPHAAWFTPQSEHDTRVKSAETMRAALFTNRPQNVIAPDMF